MFKEKLIASLPYSIFQLRIISRKLSRLSRHKALIVDMTCRLRNFPLSNNRSTLLAQSSNTRPSRIYSACRLIDSLLVYKSTSIPSMAASNLSTSTSVPKLLLIASLVDDLPLLFLNQSMRFHVWADMSGSPPVILSSLRVLWRSDSHQEKNACTYGLVSPNL